MLFLRKLIYCNLDCNIDVYYQIPDMEGRQDVISHGRLTTDDSYLPVGSGIMARGPTFTCVEMDSDNELKVLCTLNTVHGNLGSVASIGNGYFGIGRQIFKFGNPDAICVLPMDIKSGDTSRSGGSITRVLSVDEVSGAVNIMHVMVCEPDYMRVMPYADSEQEDSEQEDSEQEDSEQEDSEQEDSEQEDSEQEDSEQEDSEQEDSEQEDSEQEDSEQEDYKHEDREVYEGSIVISHFEATSEGTCTLSTKQVCQLENDSSIGAVAFWKNHLVVSNRNSPWSVIDCMTGVVVNSYQPDADADAETPSFELKFINHGTQLAVYYGNNNEYYDEVSECDETESEPVVRLLATLDIVDGNLVETNDFILQRYECADIIARAFGKRCRTDILYLHFIYMPNIPHFIYMPNILHLNRTMRSIMKYVNSSVLGYKPTENDEVLVYIPTSTILPIRGSNVHKDITILDSMVSDDGNYMVMLVTARDSHDTRLQICALNLQTGKADCATIALFSHYDHQVSARLHGFLKGNRAIVYSRTNADGIDTLVKQPIFNGVLDCIAAELFGTLDGVLPLEIVRHIVNFM